MPKKTFFNLPEVKREKIINSAMDEFSIYSFNETSVKRIIKRAEIPVGSFYQYFDDLKDLYYYILKMAMKKKYEYFKTEIDNLENRDFVSSIKAIYRAGIKFVFSDKRLFGINNNLQKYKDLSVIVDLTNSDENKEILVFLEGVIKDAINNNEIRSDINPKLIVEIIMSLSNTFTEHLLQDRPNGLSEDDYNLISDKVIAILIDGLGSN